MSSNSPKLAMEKKSSISRVEETQLQESLFKNINYLNAITEGADPETDILCRIPNHASIELFNECLKTRSETFVPAFRNAIKLYYDGVNLSDNRYNIMVRISAVVRTYQESQK